LEGPPVIDHVAALARTVIHPGTVLVPSLLLAAVLLPIAWAVARAVGAAPIAAAGAALALIGVADVTVLRPGLLHADPDWSRVATACVVTDPGWLSAETVLNVALFAPFAFLAVVAVARVVPAALAAVGVVLIVAAMSLGIEATQAAYRIGACDSSDVVHNVIGAGFGAALGGLVAGIVVLGKRRLTHYRSDELGQAVGVVRSL
jgi:VanZ like family